MSDVDLVTILFSSHEHDQDLLHPHKKTVEKDKTLPSNNSQHRAVTNQTVDNSSTKNLRPKSLLRTDGVW